MKIHNESPQADTRVTGLPDPENFRERNLQLLQSTKDFLPINKAHFGKFQFKNHSGQFRQDATSSAQCSKSCRYLPNGENFQNIFDELLELAHLDFGGFERPPRTTTRKNKSAWQSSSRQVAWTSGPTGSCALAAKSAATRCCTRPPPGVSGSSPHRAQGLPHP